MKEGMITLSQKQLKTLAVINRFIDKSITRQQTAGLLSLSTRQITRIKKGVLETSAESLIHKNMGRKPPHALLSAYCPNIPIMAIPPYHPQ